MAGSLGASGSVSGSAGLTSTYFNQLISLQLQQVQAPITQLKQDKSDLTVKRGMFVDTKISLSSLNSLALDLKNTSTSVFSAKSVSSADSTVATASGGSTALPGTYAIWVTTLAKAHRVRSDFQATTDQALGLSGTFIIGGAASRAVSNPVTVADTVTGFGTAGTIRSGQTELGSGSYSVEVQNNSGTYQFRVVDGDGQAVSIDKAGDSGTAMTEGWQNLSLVAGTTVDTARGLSITFGSGSYTAGSKGAGAAGATYTAQGAAITVSSSDSLAKIRDLISAATYAEGNGIQASIVNRALVLASAATGEQHLLAAADTMGAVLQSLGVLDGGNFKTTLQAAFNASFTVDGLTVSRSRNTGLEDVIQGVSLGLVKEGAGASVTVKPDTTAITEKISAMLQKVNGAMDYLKGKLQVAKSATTNTYTRGGLVGETVFQSLRQNLVTALRGKMSGATSTSMDELADLGIGLDSSLHFSITDSAKLQAGLESNLTGVVALLDNRMTALTTTLAPFIKPTSGALDTRITALDKRSAQIDSRITQIQKRVGLVEKQLIARYGDILSQTSTYTRDQATANILWTQSMSA
jgi:flagellar hook-associated protein 2